MVRLQERTKREIPMNKGVSPTPAMQDEGHHQGGYRGVKKPINLRVAKKVARDDKREPQDGGEKSGKMGCLKAANPLTESRR